MQVLWVARLPATYIARSTPPAAGVVGCYSFTNCNHNIIFDPQICAEYYCNSDNLTCGEKHIYHNGEPYTLMIDEMILKLVTYTTDNIRAQTQMPPGYGKSCGKLTYIQIQDNQSTVIASGGSWIVKIAIDWTKVK